MKLWVDGAPAAATLDRGLEFGDGLFETLAVVNGAPRLLERHLARLAHGCERLGIAMPASARLARELTLAAHGRGVGVLKLIVTRGAGGHGYAPVARARPRRTLVALPPRRRDPRFECDGIVARLCCTRLALQPALAGLKHLNRLEQVLARREWSDPAIPEGLMLDVQGRLICGTISNVFLDLGQGLVTPALTRCGVAGVMRAALLAGFAAAGHAVEERDVAAAELRTARELFVSNALIGVWPVRRLDDRDYPLGRYAHAARALVAKL